MKTFISIVMGGILSFSSSAFAEENFLTLDAGGVTISNGGILPNPSSVRVAAGYRHGSQNTRSKVYTELGYLSASNTTAYYSTGSVTISQYTVQMNAVFVRPIGGSNFDVTANIGYSYNNATLTGSGSYAQFNSSGNNTGMIYGFGGRYNFTDKLAIRAQYEFLGKFRTLLGAYDTDLSQIAVGLIYSY